MRTAIVSDFHGNLVAFDAVLAELERERFDLIVHGGDLAASGARPTEIIDRVRELGWPGVIGNWDKALADALDGIVPQFPERLQAIFQPIVQWTQATIGPARMSWLGSLPPEHRQEEFVLLHAAPGNLWGFVPKDAGNDVLRETYGDLGAERVIYCHIHQPFVRRVGHLTVANSGSVGLPSDGDRRASYLVLEDGEITVRRVEYDVERSIADLYEVGYPGADWVAEIQRTATMMMPSER
jgi:putative phosphoesterase